MLNDRRSSPPPKRWAAALGASLVLGAPGASFYQAAAATVQRGPLEGAPIRIDAGATPIETPALPLAETASAIPALPGLPAAQTAMAPETPASASRPSAQPLAELSAAAVAIPSLAAPQAPDAGLKAEASLAFDASAGAPAGSAAALPPALNPVAAPSGLSPAVAGSAWGRRLRAALPKVALASGIGAAAIALHALGKPEWLAWLAPILAFGGMKAGTGSGPSNDERLLEAIAKSRAPGRWLSASDTTALGEGLGLTQSDAWTALGHLAAAGHVVMFSNGGSLYVALDDDTAALPSQLRAANTVAREAVQLLNGRDFLDRIRSLHMLHRAHQAYAVYAKTHADAPEPVGGNMKQLAALKLDACLELLRSFVQDAAEEAQQTGLSRYLENSYFESGRNAASRMEAKAQALAARLTAAYDPSDHREDPQFTQIESGLKLLRSFVKNIAAPETPAAPPLSPIEAVLQQLEFQLQPGEEIGARQRADVGEALRVDVAEVEAALAQLAAANRVIRLRDGAYLYTTLPKRALGIKPGKELHSGLALAAAGVEFLNGKSLEDHALAVDGFNQSLIKYYSARYERAEDARITAEVEILYKNALLEFLNDLLKLHDGQLAAEGDAEGSEARKSLREALAWLKSVHFAADDNPELSHGVRTWLLDLVSHLRPDAYQTKHTPHGKEIGSAISLLKKFLKGEAPEDDAQDAPPPTQPQGKQPLLLTEGTRPARPSREKAFPLIKENEKKFEYLHKYGTNLTGLALQGKLKPLIGREKEMRQVVKTLMRDEKNNPLLAGETGVGKTAIVEGLAQRLIDGDVPEELQGKNIFRLNLGALIAGTRIRGEFEERMQTVIDETLASEGRVILFIDEVHRIVGLGKSDESNDASQMLLEAMGRGDFALIGATTFDKVDRIERSGLGRRFNEIKVEPPTPSEAVDILLGLKTRYERKHGVLIPEETVKAAVKQAARYLPERHLPDSALDLLDDTATEVQLKASEAKTEGRLPERIVSPDDIALEIALRTGIPAQTVSADELAALKALPAEFAKHVVGQDAAVRAVVRAMRRRRLGYADPNKPDAWLFLGPTGVGKTELAKAIARIEFGSEDALLPIDGSEYMEKHSVSRLISAPPGYVGHDEEGQLTGPVRHRPNLVVLIDEIDKMHPEALNLLLQVIDEGRLTDGRGRRVNFKNVKLVMTANYGGRHSASEEGKRLGFHTTEDQIPADAPVDPKKAAALKEQSRAELKKELRPEFLNRLGDRRIIAFEELGPEALRQIAKLKEAELNKRLAENEKDMTVSLSEAAVRYLLDDSYSKRKRIYGARPLKQTIEEELIEALVDAEIGGAIAPGDRVVADYDPAAQKWLILPQPRPAN